jgi:hypothetical protein
MSLASGKDRPFVLQLRLSGGQGQRKAGDWVIINAAGELELELIDYGRRLVDAIDAGSMVTVAAEHWPILWQHLHPQGELPRLVKPESLLEAVQARFKDYRAVRDWLEQEGIPFGTRSPIERWMAPMTDSSNP